VVEIIRKQLIVHTTCTLMPMLQIAQDIDIVMREKPQ
jgi:hypothetical protein